MQSWLGLCTSDVRAAAAAQLRFAPSLRCPLRSRLCHRPDRVLPVRHRRRPARGAQHHHGAGRAGSAGPSERDAAAAAGEGPAAGPTWEAGRQLHHGTPCCAFWRATPAPLTPTISALPQAAIAGQPLLAASLAGDTAALDTLFADVATSVDALVLALSYAAFHPVRAVTVVSLVVLCTHRGAACTAVLGPAHPLCCTTAKRPLTLTSHSPIALLHPHPPCRCGPA